MLDYVMEAFKFSKERLFHVSWMRALEVNPWMEDGRQRMPFREVLIQVAILKNNFSLRLARLNGKMSKGFFPPIIKQLDSLFMQRMCY